MGEEGADPETNAYLTPTSMFCPSNVDFSYLAKTLGLVLFFQCFGSNAGESSLETIHCCQDMKGYSCQILFRRGGSKALLPAVFPAEARVSQGSCGWALALRGPIRKSRLSTPGALFLFSDNRGHGWRAGRGGGERGRKNRK